MSSNILPLEKVIEILKTSNLPGLVGGEKYILSYYKRDPTAFTYWYNKAEYHSNERNKNGLGGSSYSLWIAANYVCGKLDYPHTFYCKYCMLNFHETNELKPQFEHFLPRVQRPSNINEACDFCNKLKADKTPEYFWDQLSDEKIIKGLQPLNKHFLPLIVRYNSSLEKHNWRTLDWKYFMITFAKNDFGIEIIDDNQFEVIRKYCILFRNKYKPK